MNASPVSNRRDFLRTSSTAAAFALAAPGIIIRESAFAANSDTLKVGLVGCGGRGTGAAGNALTADGNCVLTAVADAFEGQAAGALKGLKEQFGNRIQVTPDSTFIGLDGYKKVIDQVDVVLLASPPGFRPTHLKYAVEKGKHIFCEKPAATDAYGIREVMAAVKLAKEKKLHFVCGFCWRSDLPRRALYQQIHDGALGEVKSVYGTYLTGPVKPMPPASARPAGMSDLEWMTRNWYNFTWLSGDGLVEQAIHTVDWMMWAMKDKPPVSCTATGGRQIKAEGGNIFDHISVAYEWPGGVRGFIAQRQITGCYGENSFYAMGTKGNAYIHRGAFTTDLAGERTWKYEGPTPDMYQVEHDELFASIRAGKPLNDGDRMVTSTMAGIMGRMAGYTGQQVTWEQALNSKEELAPQNLRDWNGTVVVPPLALPGRTELI